MVASYKFWLVLLSFVVATTASYAALDLTSRVVASQGLRSERYWLFGGAAVIGCGIWSMHFIGMLAYRVPVPLSFDVPITGLSLLIAAAASWIALYVASRRALSPSRLLGGGSSMGLGIAAMHYTSMWATRVLTPIHYDVALVVLSIVIAIGTSIIALWSAFKLRLETIFTAFWKRAGSAIVMGAGICLMHYIGMAAAMFAPDSMSTDTHQTISQVGLAVILGVFTPAFLVATLLIPALYAYHADRSAEHAERLQVLNSTLEMRTAELAGTNKLLQLEVQVRTRAEDALREARDKLETRVIERTAKLVQSNEALQKQIAERKVAEHALRDREKQLRLLYDDNKHLVRNLHDNIVQSIYVAGMNLEELKQTIQQDPTRAAEGMEMTVADLNGVIRDIRRYIVGESGGHGSAASLRANLKELVEPFGSDSDPRFQLEIDAGAEGQLTPDETEHVLQIAREAASYSRRHSHAKRGTITVGPTDDGVTVEISDDGDGFDLSGPRHKGHGLYNMRARAQQMGARLEVLSSPGRGTRIVLRIHKDQGSK